eukprot:11581270-Alexandrium_andersonii.AAC.1
MAIVASTPASVRVVPTRPSGPPHSGGRSLPSDRGEWPARPRSQYPVGRRNTHEIPVHHLVS